MRVEGSCHCGAVRFEAEADPGDVSLCHCADCQRRSGSPFGVLAYYPGDAVKITGGATCYQPPRRP